MKSIETRFAEAMDALKKAGRTKQFDEKVKGCTNIESKLNAAEAVLKDVSVVRETAPIRKNNGAVENFVEGSPFNGDRANSFSPGYIKENSNPCAAGDKIMIDSMLQRGEITEAQHYKLLTGKPFGYEQLTDKQRKEFDSARLIGINEADALKVARMAGASTFREVSR